MSASHILGSEITYKHLIGNTYKITLKVYRDCRECKFSGNGGGDNNTNCNEIPGIIIRGSVGSKNELQDLGTINLTRTGIRKISKTCYKYRGACQSGSSYPYGIEEHVMEADYDFSSLIALGNCKLDLGVSISSRNKSINNLGIEQNFYNYSSINLCNGLHNNSVVFNNVPFFNVLLNQPVNYSYGASDKDRDSISFNLRPASTNPSQSIIYSPGKSFTKPLNSYCSVGNPGCIPMPYNTIPEGVFVNNLSGDIIMTPVTPDDKGVFVMEASEWRKNQFGVFELIGIVRRDIYVEVLTVNNNVPLFKNTKFDFSVCVGESICFDIDSKDMIVPGNNPDSVKFSYISDIQGARFDVNNLNREPFATATFCWTPKASDVSNIPYTFTVRLDDNACPLNASTSRTFSIHVYQKDNSAISIKRKDCGEITLENINGGNRNDNTYWWEIYDIDNKMIALESGIKLTYKFDKGGKYYIVNKISNINTGCQNILKDSVTIPVFNKPSFTLGPDVFICKGAYSFAPVNVSADAPVTWLYNGQPVQMPYNVDFEKTETGSVILVDNNGCKVQDNIVINVYPEIIAFMDTAVICSNSIVPLNLDNYLKTDRSKLGSIDFASNDAQVLIYKKSGIWYFETGGHQPGKVDLIIRLSDKNGCVKTIGGSVVLIKPLDLRYTQIRDICLNESDVNLRIETEIQLDNGIWNIASVPDAINGDKLSPSRIKSPGIYSIHYFNSNKGCPLEKDLTVTFKSAPVIVFDASNPKELCKTGNSVNLKVSPSGGKWSANGITAASFNPSASLVNPGINKIYYKVEDPQTKCATTDSAFINVNVLPVLTLQADKLTICDNGSVTLTGNSSSGSSVFWETNGTGILSGTSAIFTYKPSVADALLDNVRITIKTTASGGCPEAFGTVSIKVKSVPAGIIIVSEPASLCDPTIFKFTTSVTNIDKQTWVVNGNTSAEYDYSFPFETILHAGNYKIEALVEREGCSAIIALPQPVEVFNTPKSFFVTDPSEVVNREYPRIRFEDRSSCPENFKTRWTIGNVDYGSNKDFYLTLSNDTDIYVAKISSYTDKGCISEYSKTLRLSPTSILFIPNAFSPDSKGPEANNLFKVEGPEMKVFSIIILNKWGEKIFESKSMDEAWDGNYLNKPAASGVYVYKISVTDKKGEERDYAGTVTLMR
ncbi:MAG: gliding motility-associated C-terminal domain-containing protein [Bacteroidia bacterium]|nr:gliding motility-associated C-terminal domain-containing protein [Bacteroidia bacterium]